MDKNTLMQYCDLKREIKKLEKRIERLQQQSEIVSDVVQNGYKRHAVISGYDLKRSEKLHKLEEIIKIRYDKALAMQTQIENFINTIQRSDIRQIFEHRYIEDMNWVQIQIEMEYEHEDTARRKHDRFLRNF